MDNQQIMREAANQQHMMNQRQMNQPVHEEYQQNYQEDQFPEQPVQQEPTASEMNDGLVSSVNIPQRQLQQTTQVSSASTASEEKSISYNVIDILFEPILLVLLLMIFFHPTSVSTLRLHNYLGSLADEKSFTMNLAKRILALVAIFFIVRQIYFYFRKN